MFSEHYRSCEETYDHVRIIGLPNNWAFRIIIRFTARSLFAVTRSSLPPKLMQSFDPFAVTVSWALYHSGPTKQQNGY